jgi:HK97 family phage major capsid protein
MSDKLNEAKKLVHDLVQSQKSSDNRFAQIEKKLDDLNVANRKIAEHVTDNKSIARPIGDDTILSRYREEDGTLILKNKTIKKQIEGRGTMSFEQEGLLDAAVPANDWHAELKRQVEERTLARMTMAEPYTPKADATLYRHLLKAPGAILPSIEKAFNDQAGTGAEFIPDEFVSSLYEPFAQRGNLRSLVQSQQVDRNTILIPRMNRGSRPYIKSQIVSNDPALYQASDIETAQKTINIKGYATRIIVDDAAAEDSAFAMTSLLRSTLAQDLEDAWEDCAINGDTTGAQDLLTGWNIRGRWGANGLGTASDHRLLFNGWRKEAFSKASTHDIAAAGQPYLEFTDLISMLGKMGEYGVSKHVLICSPEVMVGGIMNMTQTTTLDKFGSNAVILKGQIASVMGMPVIMSRFMSSDLAATGKYTGAGATSGCLIVSMDSYYEYLRRGITVETDKNIASGGIEIVATLRSVLGSPDPAANKNVCFGFNHS